MKQFLKYLINVLLLYLFYKYIILAVLILSILISAVIVIGSKMSSRSTLEEAPARGNVEPTVDTTPSIFVDVNLLKKSMIASCEKNENIFRKIYKIQDMMYADDCNPTKIDGFNASCNKLVKFELKEVDSEPNLDNNCSKSKEKNDDEGLIISHKRLASGYIINSNVYLTMQQWHTIVSLPEFLPDVLNCIVCNSYFLVSLKEHIKTKKHKNQLDKYKPLRRFEFSVTRKIKDMFHCGVCNETYPVTEETFHNNHYNHEYNLLAAINKATDYLYNNDGSENNSMSIVFDNASIYRKDIDKYIIDDSDVGSDDLNKKYDFEATSVDYNSSDDDNNNGFDVGNDVCNDKDHRHHINSDVPVRLTKYIKFDEDTNIGTDTFERSNVIQLTSNSVDALNISKVKHDRQTLGISGNIKNIGITKQIGHFDCNDHSNETIRTKPCTPSDDQKTRKTESSKKSDATKQSVVKSNDTYDPNDRFMDENVQIIIKKTHFVIDLFAYNTIVFYGDTKYCFFCNMAVSNERVRNHINKKLHIDNMSRHSFLDNYSKHLIRQNLFKYHCGICNVLINHPHLAHHLEWTTHQKLAIQCKTKKSLRKSIKVINVTTQREDGPSNVNAPKIKILFHVEIVAAPQTKQTVVMLAKKKVILNGRIFAIDFCNWNGLCELENGFRCFFCEENVTDDIEMHCRDRHDDVALKNIDEKYWPALIRKVNDKNVHCISCNKLLFNDEELIRRHIKVKKHKKNHSKLLKE